MRKIIAAFASPHFSEATMRFIKSLDNAEQVTVTGMFLPLPIFTKNWSYANNFPEGLLLPLSEDTDEDELNENVSRFKLYCSTNNIRHRIIKGTEDFVITALKEQSRYADLLVLGGQQFYNLRNKHQVSEYLRSMLHDTECPVIVLPESYRPPVVNLLLFDGSESSAKAIKSFAYLLPEFSKNPTTILRFGPKRTVDKDIEALTKQFVSMHFPDNRLVHIEGNHEDYFSNWENENKPAIVVCGSFGRSLFSVMLKHSFIGELLHEGTLPVFIAHK